VGWGHWPQPTRLFLMPENACNKNQFILFFQRYLLTNQPKLIFDSKMPFSPFDEA
jgi:hypothetical protein